MTRRFTVALRQPSPDVAELVISSAGASTVHSLSRDQLKLLAVVARLPRKSRKNLSAH
jgi:hypothetical protein